MLKRRRGDDPAPSAGLRHAIRQAHGQGPPLRQPNRGRYSCRFTINKRLHGEDRCRKARSSVVPRGAGFGAIGRDMERSRTLRYRGHFIASLALLSTTGCASLFSGSHQEIAVSSTPEQASCSLSRNGAVIATVASTPGTANVKKSSRDIVVACEKPGYQTGNQRDEAGTDAWVFGNAVIGGAVGVGIDFATGAVHKYDSTVNVALVPAGVDVPQAPTLPLVQPAPQPVADQAPAQPVVRTATYRPPPQPAPVQVAAASSHRVFGIGVLPVDPSSAAGVRVMIVQDGSIAAKSGIAAGDVLVSLDGEPVNQKGDVQRIVSSRAEGAIVSVHLVRNGAPMDLATQL